MSCEECFNMSGCDFMIRLTYKKIDIYLAGTYFILLNNSIKVHCGTLKQIKC